MRLKLSSRVSSYMNRLKRCTDCDLRTCCRQVVPGGGSVPADILFQGIAPGKSEDLLGEPFVGPSGRLLNELIDDACRIDKIDKRVLKIFKTNSVLCRSSILDPDSDKFNNNADPTEAQILACMPKVVKLIRMVKPKLIIFCGRLPEKFYQKSFPDAVEIHHPSYLLKDGGVESRYYRQNVRKLAEALEIFK